MSTSLAGAERALPCRIAFCGLVHTPFTFEQRQRNSPAAWPCDGSHESGGKKEDPVESRSPADVLKLAKDEGAEFVDLRFCDLPGLMQHFSMPIHELTEDGFDDGYGFDGSSIRGFQEIQESDMLLIPDPDTAVMDPFREHKTININCFVQRPGHGRVVHPRPALHRQEGRGVPQGHRHRRHRVLRARGRVLHLRQRALRPERSTRATTSSTRSRACGTPARRANRRFAEPRLQAAVQGGLLPRPADGPLPGPPVGDGARSSSATGIEIEVQHHEVGTAGQAEIDMRFDTLLTHGRQAHALQVRRQERRVAARQVGHASCRSRSSGTTARACTCTSRCGRAASRCSSTRRATPASPTWRAGTSAVC